MQFPHRLMHGSCPSTEIAPARPARSYEHTRAKRAAAGPTSLQSTEKFPAPASRIIVGCEVLAQQLRCKRHPPRSINWPGGGKGGNAVALRPCAPAVAPISRSTSRASDREPVLRYVFGTRFMRVMVRVLPRNSRYQRVVPCGDGKAL